MADDTYVIKRLQDLRDILAVKLGTDSDGRPYYGLRVVSDASATVSGTFNGAMTAGDGDIVTLGSRSDSIAASYSGTYSVVSLIKLGLEYMALRLPSSLTGLGNFRASIQEYPTGTNSIVVQGPTAYGAAVVTNPQLVGGVAYNPDAGPTNVASGTHTRLFTDLNGRLLVYLATKLDRTNDAITAFTPKTSTVNTPAISSTQGDTLAANTSRIAWKIQNLGTSPLFVRLGTGVSPSLFHVVLKGGTGNDDGLGGFFEDTIWTGIVSVTGTSARYALTEIT